MFNNLTPEQFRELEIKLREYLADKLDIKISILLAKYDEIETKIRIENKLQEWFETNLQQRFDKVIKEEFDKIIIAKLK